MGIYFIQREYVLSTANMCYPICINVIQHENLLFNANTCYIQNEIVLFNATNVLSNVIMRYTVIECKNMVSTAGMFYPMLKYVYQCKNRVIQREKVLSNARNVLYNVTNVIFYKKIIREKFSLRKRMI